MLKPNTPLTIAWHNGTKYETLTADSAHDMITILAEQQTFTRRSPQDMSNTYHYRATGKKTEGDIPPHQALQALHDAGIITILQDNYSRELGAVSETLADSAEGHQS